MAQATVEKAHRTPVVYRMLDPALAEVDKIAAEHFDGNRSAAIKALLRLGMAAWRRGER